MKSSAYLRIGWLAKTKSLILISSFILTTFAPDSSGRSVDRGLDQVLYNSLNQPELATSPFDAQVWLVDMSARLSSYIEDPALRVKLLRLIYQEAQRASLKPELVLAVIETESAFNRFAISSAGAQGLMQVMPFWKEVIGRTSDNLTQIHTNLRYGCTILSYYLNKEKGNLTRALARYNGSLGKTWYAERVLTNWQKNWRSSHKR